MTRRRTRDQRGTATMEVLGMTPLVILFVLVLTQTAIALYAITTAQTAARQGARALSQGDDPRTVVRETIPSWMGVDTQIYAPTPGGKGVRVVVDVPDAIPFFDLEITKETVMP